VDSLHLAAALLGLVAAVGLNPFAVLLVFSLATRTGLVADLVPGADLGPFAETWFLVVAGVLFLVTAFSDKIPGLDHLQDVAMTVVKPIAAAFLALTMSEWIQVDAIPHAVVLAVAVVGGASVALGVHGTKATFRAASTTTTGGLGNPVVSVAEDALALGGTWAILAHPMLAIAVALLVLGGLVASIVRWRRRRAGSDLAS